MILISRGRLFALRITLHFNYSDFNADLKSILPLLKQKLSCSVVVELSVCFMMLLVRFQALATSSGPTLSRKPRGEGEGAVIAPTLCSGPARAAAFQHSCTVSFSFKSTKLIVILTMAESGTIMI